MSDPKKQNPCCWIDPSEESLPPLATPVPPESPSKTKARNPNPCMEQSVTGDLLTVPEKEYWKSRIEKRIEQQWEAIYAHQPQFMEHLQRESRQRALVSLGLLDWQIELEAIEHHKARLEARRRQVERSMLAQVRGIAAQDLDDYESHRHHREVGQAITRRQSVHQDELLAESEIGQQILRLREVKEALIDRVWLANTQKQIQELWLEVANLLNNAQTTVEQAVLTIVTKPN